MKTEKMTYEKPTVQKVEFDFKTRIAGSGCGINLTDDPGDDCSLGN
jgi:hypothetical protein